MIRAALIALIRGYQKFISPHLGDNCRFYPTCSAYAIEALRVHGVCKGVLLAGWRILRCNPFGKGGVDPVPPKGQWKNTAEDVANFKRMREETHRREEARRKSGKNGAPE